MKKGFTLIEILIVVVIIGILTSIVLVGVGGFRERARDTKRVADLRQVQGALEIYYSKGNAYPSAATWGDLSIILAPSIIPTMPKDPLNDATHAYTYVSDGAQHYVLEATLETKGNKVLDDDIDGSAFQGLSVGCGIAEENDDNTEYCVGM